MIAHSVIVPCRNEAASIQSVLRRLREVLPDAEVIVVDDGSTDATARVAAEVAGIKVIRLARNSGKGVALRAGVAAAQGETLVFIDGDGQDDPDDVPRLLAEFAAGARFVNGSKFIGTIETGGISRPNYFGNRFMSWLINLLFGACVTDSQSGFRAVERALVRQWRLTSTQYEIETEMLCKALKAGVAIREVPVTRRARTGGATGFRRVRNGLRILRTILQERLTR
jgi:glycosyltransferase involved in cell wall biosynthesis